MKSAIQTKTIKLLLIFILFSLERQFLINRIAECKPLGIGYFVTEDAGSTALDEDFDTSTHDGGEDCRFS